MKVVKELIAEFLRFCLCPTRSTSTSDKPKGELMLGVLIVVEHGGDADHAGERALHHGHQRQQRQNGHRRQLVVRHPSFGKASPAGEPKRSTNHSYSSLINASSLPTLSLLHGNAAMMPVRRGLPFLTSICQWWLLKRTPSRGNFAVLPLRTSCPM